MNFAEIVAALDELIERYRRARVILASLQTTPSQPKGTKAPQTKPALQSEDVVPPALPQLLPVTATVLPPVFRKQRTKPAKRVLPPPALAGVRPMQPVVVPAAEVLRRREASAASGVNSKSTPAQAGHSLEDLVRELKAREPGLVSQHAA